MPEALKGQNLLLNIYGNNSHMIVAKSDENTMFWKYVILIPPRSSKLTICCSSTMREDEAKETWKAMDDAKVEDFKKNSIFANWDFHGGELVKTGYNLTRVITFLTICVLYDADFVSSLACMIAPSSRYGTKAVSSSSAMQHTQRAP